MQGGAATGVQAAPATRQASEGALVLAASTVAAPIYYEVITDTVTVRYLDPAGQELAFSLTGSGDLVDALPSEDPAHYDTHPDTALHHLQAQSLQLMDRRLQQNAGLRLLRAPGERTARIDLVLRCRQLDQPFSVHPQQRHPAAHVFQATIGFAPIKKFAYPIRQLLAVYLRMRMDQFADLLDLLQAKKPTAVALVR